MDQLGPQKERVHLVEGNVLDQETPACDMTVAFNFSYWIFKTREQLGAYFSKVYAGLKPDGLLVLDMFGGTTAGDTCEEERIIEDKTDWKNDEIPPFSYIWEQAWFNAVTHEMRCYIHFEFPDQTRIERAFRYEWRLWSIPEIVELLREAGFSDTEVHTHGWTKDGESDDRYQPVTHFDNEDAWLGYIVGIKRSG